MPVYNIVKVRMEWADQIVEAHSYEEAIEIAKHIPVEPNEIEYGEWEIDTQLGGQLNP